MAALSKGHIQKLIIDVLSNKPETTYRELSLSGYHRSSLSTAMHTLIDRGIVQCRSIITMQPTSGKYKQRVKVFSLA